jgi:hypothetical protein|tara:strand:- start:17423 stop:18025 length:603 start_codon:yes stop_codon:yes gene_type:complete
MPVGHTDLGINTTIRPQVLSLNPLADVLAETQNELPINFPGIFNTVSPAKLNECNRPLFVRRSGAVVGHAAVVVIQRLFYGISELPPFPKIVFGARPFLTGRSPSSRNLLVTHKNLRNKQIDVQMCAASHMKLLVTSRAKPAPALMLRPRGHIKCESKPGRVCRWEHPSCCCTSTDSSPLRDRKTLLVDNRPARSGSGIA